MPTIPQCDAGWRMDPPVSEPKAKGTKPEAKEAALPPEDPPGIQVRSQGLKVF